MSRSSSTPAELPAGSESRRPQTRLADTSSVESFQLELYDPTSGIGVATEFVVMPTGRAAFSFSVVGFDERLLSLIELDAAAPPLPGLELRATGLWCEYAVQTPFDHVTVDLEAFAVALDDPDEVFRGAYGERMPLGAELEWETDGEPVAHRLDDAELEEIDYAVPCRCHGELLVGHDAIEVDGWGWRSHRSGAPDPRDRQRSRGRAGDGGWLIIDEPEPPSELLGSAPVVDPWFDDSAGLDQELRRAADGAVWWRRALR